MSRILLFTTLAVTVVLTGCPTQAPAPCQIQPSGNGPYTIKMTNTGSATASCPAVMGDQWFFDNYAAGLIVMVAASSTIPFPPDTTSSVYGKGTITYTPSGGTACTYDAQAINPSATCASNADCNPTSEPINSGINYLYDQGCNKEAWATAITGDPATGICFFNKPFPSLGGFTP